MKKKILLISLMVMLFACVLAISASAAIVKHETDPGLDCAESAVTILDYDAFNNSTASDKESRVVMTDGTYYYVFPAYYVFSTNSNFQPNLTNINAAMKAADSTITEDLFTNKKTDYVRIEFPTWITNIDQGTGKLENWTAIKEVRFTTALKTITAHNAFSNCTNLEFVSDFSHITAMGNSTFSGCSKLALDVIWPSGVTYVPPSTFSGCKITSIQIPEGITSIGSFSFYGCKMTEVILPNSVTSIAKGAFSNCKQLVTFSFGAGFKTLTRTNADYETFFECDSLKYVYMPAGFLTAVSAASAGDYKHIFNGIDSKVTFFFTGTEEEAAQIKSLMALTTQNPTLGNAIIEKYDKNKNYTDYGTTKDSNVIVWGYNLCDAFYESNHIFPEATTLSIDSYVKGFDELCVCNTCKDAQKLNDKEYAPIFTLLGYSAKIGGDRICVGYSLNYESLQKYEAVTGKTLSFGVVATIPSAGEDVTALEPVKAEIAPNDEYTIFANITGTYASFDFLITGFSEEYYDTALVMCAFVGDSEKVDYICGNSEATTQSEYASLITFG